LDARVAPQPRESDRALKSALAERQESMRVKFDFSESQMIIGGMFRTVARREGLNRLATVRHLPFWP
jgi:hypothetical protein